MSLYAPPSPPKKINLVTPKIIWRPQKYCIAALRSQEWLQGFCHWPTDILTWAGNKAPLGLKNPLSKLMLFSWKEKRRISTSWIIFDQGRDTKRYHVIKYLGYKCFIISYVYVWDTPKLGRSKSVSQNRFISSPTSQFLKTGSSHYQPYCSCSTVTN